MDLWGVSWEIWFMYALIIGVFISFVVERVPPDITSMGALCLLFAVGILNSEEALAVFSNAAPITIGAMFIISAALERTGCIQLLGGAIARIAGRSQLSLLVAILPVVIIISALMNNTPVVIVLTPVLIALARKINLAPSKVLMPLSFAAIFGGTTTLIGTSTNLLVSGIASERGLPAFGIFDITLPGMIMAAVGSIYLLLIGRHLLPERLSASGLVDPGGNKKYIAQLLVPNGAKIIGQELAATDLFRGDSIDVIDVIRHGDSQHDTLGQLICKAGDRIVVETNSGEIFGLTESGDMVLENAAIDELPALSAAESVTIEGIVASESNLIGKLTQGLGFRHRYGVYVVGINKMNRRGRHREDMDRLQAGDTLLLHGPAAGMQTLFAENDLINLTIPEKKTIRRRKAPIAIGTIMGVVILAAFNVMPIELLAIIGAGVVTVTRCIDARDIYKTVDWSILFLIFGMLGLSIAMDETGAAQLLVDHIVNNFSNHGPLILLACFYILTSVMTEIVSNNAVAALLTPIVIAVAASMNLDPTPFLVAVMFGGSASFATPIGYQTNTFVYGAGGYKFRDFLVVGLPLNIIMFVVAMIVIPLFWSF